MLEVSWPCRLVGGMNAREHWGARQRRAKKQRDAALLLLANEIRKRGQSKPPWVVTITRSGPRKLDDDNLAISAKHVRDGIADALGVDDGDESMIRWKYLQSKGAHGVRVVVESSND